ncbi:uncharacterized protein sb:cb288 isoform X2 [Xiphias gladius]|nr:uncharacterized protein sb:cb288 isoform X2 [Xiphias gladius]
MFSGKVRVSNDALEGSTRGASQRPAEVRRRQRRELSAQPQNKMWTEAKYKNKTVVGIGNSSKMVDPDLALQLLHAVQQRNGSTGAATRPSFTEESLTRSSGIIPGERHFDQNLMSLQTQDLFQRRTPALCNCSHSVHCLFTCSIRRPLEVHGVSTTTKAQKG